MKPQLKTIIDAHFAKATNRPNVHKASLMVEVGEESYFNTHREVNADSLIAFASVTKLYTTACILKMVDEQRIKLSDTIADYIANDLLRDLHVFKQHDYSLEITIEQLLTQTSGIADIFLESKDNLTAKGLKGDIYVPVEKQLEMNSKLKPHFTPGTNKSYYSDINFNLLGLIIESITQLSLEEAYKKYIYSPLGLSNTFLVTEATYQLVPSIYNEDQTLIVPKFLHSNGAAGGITSTTQEVMVFLKAFFKGRLFPLDLLSEESYRLQLNMTPIRYARGMMLIPLSGVTTMFNNVGILVGHSGLSGSFAFYWPEKETFIVGDFSQVANPSLPIRFIMQLAVKLSMVL